MGWKKAKIVNGWRNCLVFVNDSCGNTLHYLELEAQKTPVPEKGTSALGSWFHPDSAMNSRRGQPPQARYIHHPHWIRYRGSDGELYWRPAGSCGRLRKKGRGSSSRLRRGNFDPFAEEGFTNPLSLWAARNRNHVSGHCHIFRS